MDFPVVEIVEIWRNEILSSILDGLGLYGNSVGYFRMGPFTGPWAF